MGCTSGASAGKGGASGARSYADSAKKGSESFSNGLPELSGSQKQKEWANNIRDNVPKSIESIIDNSVISGRSTSTGEAVYKELTPEIKAKVETARDLRDVLKEKLATKTNAGDIINARNELSYDNLNKIVKQNAAARIKIINEGKESAFLDAAKKRGIKANSVREGIKQGMKRTLNL